MVQISCGGQGVEVFLRFSILLLFGHHDKAEGGDQLVLAITMVKESLHDLACHHPSVALIEPQHFSDLGLLLCRYPELPHELTLLLMHSC
jgi:hypothetical protein